MESIKSYVYKILKFVFNGKVVFKWGMTGLINQTGSKADFQR
jgi:hypothetical protein